MRKVNPVKAPFHRILHRNSDRSANEFLSDRNMCRLMWSRLWLWGLSGGMGRAEARFFWILSGVCQHKYKVPRNRLFFMTSVPQIILDPSVLAGKPVIRGTRISFLNFLHPGGLNPLFCTSIPDSNARIFLHVSGMHKRLSVKNGYMPHPIRERSPDETAYLREYSILGCPGAGGYVPLMGVVPWDAGISL